MSPVFIFAEQVWEIVRSGKAEIEIPEGARISSAAADLIKEHNIQVKTMAPGKVSAGESSQVAQAAEGTTDRSPVEDPSDLSQDEREMIVDRVIERFNRLKGKGPAKPFALKPAKEAPTKEDAVDDEDDLVICRCEEITRSEIKAAIGNGIHTLNGVKRITRAGMGLCQGQTCQQLVARILAKELGLSAAEIEPTTARGPVRPLRLEVFANS